VGLFPEGQFPWDGHPLPMQPGLAQLVAYLDVPVVTIRLTNGDRLWPPWAKHPRRTKLRIDIDPPTRFSGTDVASQIAQRLYVDPETCDRWPAYGRGTAEGLSKFLRYCPKCGADGGLIDLGDRLSCAECRHGWAVTTENRLIGDGDAMTIARARQESHARWQERWRRTGELRSAGVVDVLDVSRRECEHLATGVLSLDPSGLSVGDFRLDAREILAHTLDWGERIVVRTPRRRLAIRMPHDSRSIWSLALDVAIGGATREPMEAAA
jgi:hypothetical protein